MGSTSTLRPQTPAAARIPGQPLVCWLEECRKESVPLVGGKCSSLGELINAGVRVPPGFALTTQGFRSFLSVGGLDREIARLTQDKETAEKALAAAETAANELREQLDTSSTLLARYKAEKGALSGGVTMASVKGVVQAVDNKVDIYVISVGIKDKVEVGYEFMVYRGSDYVSTIVIDKVFPNYASGRTKPGTKKRDVMAGDECATRL